MDDYSQSSVSNTEVCSIYHILVKQVLPYLYSLLFYQSPPKGEVVIFVLVVVLWQQVLRAKHENWINLHWLG